MKIYLVRMEIFYEKLSFFLYRYARAYQGVRNISFRNILRAY